MAKGRLLFQHPIVQKESAKVAERRQELLEALPQIEQAYYEGLKSKSVRSVTKSPEAADEALRFYNAAITDGRYAHLLASNPAVAAKKLKMKVSEEALDVVKKIVTEFSKEGAVQVLGLVEAAIAVSVVAARSGFAEGEDLVIDSSAYVSRKL